MGDFATYEIQLSESGRSNKVVINGQDITDQCIGVDIQAAPMLPSVVTVHTAAEVKIVGMGTVIQKVHSREHIEAIVKKLNLKDLDQRAMNKSGWGSEGTLTEHVVETLLEMIGENQT